MPGSRVPVTPKILTPLRILDGTRSVSPLTTTLLNSFPLSGDTVCCEADGVTVLFCDGVGLTVTFVKYLPLVGVTDVAAVPAVTVFVSVEIAVTVTAPVVYTPLATAVCELVLGVTVFAACVVSCLVADFVPATT